jgi:D-threo-aldose 1-dehydrogenase
VRAIGAACWDPDLLLRFARAGEFDAFMLPGRYTLLDQSAQNDLLPFCAETGVSVFVAAPFYSGILATGAKPGAKFNYEDAPPDVVEKVQRIEAICAGYGVALPAAALQFPLGHPAVAAVVAGARTESELAANLQHMESPIPAEFWSAMIAAGILANGTGAR